MSILHSQVSRIDGSWLVSCQDVPTEAFDGRLAGIDAAMTLVHPAEAGDLSQR